MKLRVFAWIGIAIGLGAIGCAAALVLERLPTVEPGAIVVEGPDIGTTAVYTEVPAAVRIHNNSDVPIRFIGGPNGCQRGGCMHTTGPCPLTIPAHETADVPLAVTVSTVGPFRLSVCVYLDLAGVAVERTVDLTGTGIPAAAQAASAQP